MLQTLELLFLSVFQKLPKRHSLFFIRKPATYQDQWDDDDDEDDDDDDDDDDNDDDNDDDDNDDDKNHWWKRLERQRLWR